MNDNPTNERLAQAAQVKRIFDHLDDIFMLNKHDARIDNAAGLAVDELTDLLRSLGVEVVR